MNSGFNLDLEMDNKNSSKLVILCDMDGTLIDTNYANNLSYKRAILEVANISDDTIFCSEDRINRASLKKNMPLLTDKQYEDIVSLKTKYYSEYLPETKVNSNLVSFLEKYSGTNEVVLVTCSREQRAVETLSFHNLLGFFSRLICWESLSGSGLSNKYLNALNLLSVNPLYCIVFENDPFEINEALLAGVPRFNIISIDCQGEGAQSYESISNSSQ